MDGLKLFVPITKVDAVKRMVYGTAVDETPDHTKEIFDYDSSKPLFQAWSAGFEKLTAGKSLGNIRAMHGKVAAGKVEQIGFDDTRKAIDLAGKIVDDAEWNKVLEGVYTGFSIGGAYARKWKDGDHTRYTASPSEISIVDLPCVPSATFSMIKADGTEELRKFKTVEAPVVAVVDQPTAGEVAARAEQLAKAAGRQADWPGHIEAARAELLKEAGLNPQADAANVPKGGKSTPAHEGKQGFMADEGSGETKIGDDGKTVAASIKKPVAVANNKDGQPPVVSDKEKEDGAESNVSNKALESEAQVWVHPDLPGQTFVKKADMRQALVENEATKAAAAKAVPVLDALKGIAADLDKREGKKIEFTIAEIIGKGHDAKVCAAVGAPAAEWATFKVWLAENGDALAKALVNTNVPAITIEGDAVTVPAAAAAAIAKLMAKAAADVVEKRDFTQAERDAAAKDGSAMKDGSFPIKSKGDLKNAVEAHGRAKNKAAAKRHIVRRAKALGATDSLPDGWATKLAGDGTLVKAASLFGVSNLLMLIASLESAEEAVEVDEYWGGAVNVAKELKDRFGQALVEVGDIAAELLDAVLASMKDEEGREAMERTAPILDLMKVGARHSNADKGLIKKVHDTVVQLDKGCCPAGDGEAAKAGEIDTLNKKLEANESAFSKQLGEIGDMLKDIAGRVRRIEDTPIPLASSAFRTVTKGHDTADEADRGPELPADPTAVLKTLADAAIRMSQRSPIRVG